MGATTKKKKKNILTFRFKTVNKIGIRFSKSFNINTVYSCVYHYIAIGANICGLRNSFDVACFHSLAWHPASKGSLSRTEVDSRGVRIPQDDSRVDEIWRNMSEGQAYPLLCAIIW